MATTTSTPSDPATSDHDVLVGADQTKRIARALRKNTFCTIATVSDAGFPHSAGVVYEWADGALWIHTMRSSRKCRNLASNDRAAITVPFRRLPAGPPFTLHFQARTDLVPMDDPEATKLIASGALASISGHGALDEPDGMFVRIRPTGTMHSYGPGARVLDIIRDPLHSGSGRASAGDVVDAAS